MKVITSSTGKPFDLMCLVGFACSSPRRPQFATTCPPTQRVSPRPGEHDRAVQQTGAEAYLVRRLRFRIRELAGVSKRKPLHAGTDRRSLFSPEKLGPSWGKITAGSSRPEISLVVLGCRG